MGNKGETENKSKVYTYIQFYGSSDRNRARATLQKNRCELTLALYYTERVRIPEVHSTTPRRVPTALALENSI